MKTIDVKPSAVRTLLESRVKPDGQRSAALITMTSEMVALALRGDIHQYQHVMRSELRKAISAATGCKAEQLIVDVPQQFAQRPYSVDYSDSLATRMRDRHWDRLQAGFERAHGKRWEKARDDVWVALEADAQRYDLNAWSNPDDPPLNTPGDNLLTTLFYFISFATLNDGEAMEQMSNLVRLLPYAVPIGESRPQSGLWRYVIHPAL